jgi:hypothetical protein
MLPVRASAGFTPDQFFLRYPSLDRCHCALFIGLANASSTSSIDRKKFEVEPVVYCGASGALPQATSPLIDLIAVRLSAAVRRDCRFELFRLQLCSSDWRIAQVSRTLRSQTLRPPRFSNSCVSGRVAGRLFQHRSRLRSRKPSSVLPQLPLPCWHKLLPAFCAVGKESAARRTSAGSAAAFVVSRFRCRSEEYRLHAMSEVLWRPPAAR